MPIAKLIRRWANRHREAVANIGVAAALLVVRRIAVVGHVGASEALGVTMTPSKIMRAAELPGNNHAVHKLWR